MISEFTVANIIEVAVLNAQAMGLRMQDINEHVLKVPGIVVDDRMLLVSCLVVHCHERVCINGCFVEWLLGQGANFAPSGVRMTPLQLAIHRCDYHSSRLLLQAGADANAIGDMNGQILPGIDTAFSSCSPLHIIRTSAYGLQNIEKEVNLKDVREARWADIEALLLEFGAMDFVVGGTKDEAIQDQETFESEHMET